MKNLMRCELCQRIGDPIYFEKHHLIPGKHRTGHDEAWIWVDRSCGDAIHQQLSNVQLRTEFNTLEKLRTRMASFIVWVRKQPIDAHVGMKKKKRKL